MSQNVSNLVFDARYPSVNDLKRKARRRIPGFAFDYLEGGCNEDINLARNESDIQEIELMPQYLRRREESDIGVRLFGMDYDAPFGIAPMGLQGLIWPGSVEILAKASLKHNIPFVLSTVTTSSIERIAEITEGKSWFQLYYPADDEIRNDIIERAEAARCPVLVLLADVPTFGFRPRDIRNRLAMPPKMSLTNVLQILAKPGWAWGTLANGRPRFEILEPYRSRGLDVDKVGEFMARTFEGRLTEERIAPIREKWKGTLVIKGIVSEQDTEKAIKFGVDGIIVSNHGGRQLDAGQSTIKPLRNLSAKFGDKITIMMDSGIRSGPDIARSIACGARFTFLGRPFMYGVAALGKQGGDHTISVLKIQVKQVLEQVACGRVEDLPEHLIRMS